MQVVDTKEILEGTVNRQANATLPGLVLSGGIGAIAYGLWWVSKEWLLISPLLWAFAVSLAIGNLVPLGRQVDRGIRFASTRLLRIAVASLGVTISASAWWLLGPTGLLIVLSNLAITLILGFIICRVLLKLTIKQAILLCTGTAICGASAIAATAPAIKADERDTALALAVITMFGLAAMFLYPILYNLTALGDWLAHDPLAFGLWSGTGIHETAQVIASASQVEGALDFATLAKSIRIFMIGPVVFLSVLVFRRSDKANQSVVKSIPWPWFALVFVGLTFVHVGMAEWLGSDWTDFAKTWISPLVKMLLTWAFAAVGLRVRFADLRAVGGKAILAGLLVACVAGITAFGLTAWLWS